MPKVSEEHLQARREQILGAAREVIARRGIAATSMADIVAATGLSTGAVYRYFDSKDALVLAVCADGLDDVAARLSPDRTAREAVAELVGLASATDHARMALQVWVEGAFHAELGAMLARNHRVMREHLADLIRADRHDGGSPALYADDAADAILAALAGLRERAAVGADVDPARFRATLEALLGLAGVGPAI